VGLVPVTPDEVSSERPDHIGAGRTYEECSYFSWEISQKPRDPRVRTSEHVEIQLTGQTECGQRQPDSDDRTQDGTPTNDDPQPSGLRWRWKFFVTRSW
jgi:hypothetical protein